MARRKTTGKPSKSRPYTGTEIDALRRQALKEYRTDSDVIRVPEEPPRRQTPTPKEQHCSLKKGKSKNLLLPQECPTLLDWAKKHPDKYREYLKTANTRHYYDSLIWFVEWCVSDNLVAQNKWNLDYFMLLLVDNRKDIERLNTVCEYQPDDEPRDWRPSDCEDYAKRRMDVELAIANELIQQTAVGGKIFVEAISAMRWAVKRYALVGRLFKNAHTLKYPDIFEQEHAILAVYLKLLREQCPERLKEIARSDDIAHTKPANPEPLTNLQEKIVETLKDRPMTALSLTDYLDNSDFPRDEATVKRALGILRKKGLIANKRGRGYYVLSN